MTWPDITWSANPTWPDWLPESAALPAWLGAAALLAALTLWTYLGSGGGLRRVVVVLLLRLAALAIALLVALRPSFGMQMLEGLEPSRLVIVVDASQSMDIPDDFGSISRWEHARRILAARPVADALKRLSADEQIEVVYYQAAETVSEFHPEGSADGKRTDIGTWLHELYTRHAGQDKLRAVILFSDGADNGTRYPTLDEARKWKGVCPIYTFGHGKPQEDSERKDIVVASIQAEKAVPAKTKFTVSGMVHAPGFKDTQVKVKLLAQGSKAKEPTVLAEKDVQLKDEKNNKMDFVLDAPETPDEYKLTLRIEPVEGEADVTNNEASTYVQVTKDGVSVLWVEGRKRAWEPIFAIRALAGDKRFRVYPFEAGAATPVGPSRFERDKRHYDVVVIGDLSVEKFTGGDPSLLTELRDQVRDKKTGLLMLGGIDTFKKGGWDRTPLVEVLPAKLDSDKQIDNRVPVEPDPNANGYPFLQLDERLWKSKAARLDGMASLGTIDPGAVVLARNKDTGEPILVVGKYGSRVLVFGGDTTWRAWRRPDTVDAYNKFWRQAVLWVANQDDRTGNLWVELKSRRVLAGSPDRLEFRFRLEGKAPQEEVPAAQYEVYAEGPGNQKIAIRPEAGKNERRGVLAAPSTPGEYFLVIRGQGKDAGGAVVKDEVRRPFLVVAENLELQRKAPDHDHLKDVSAASGGEFSPAGETDLLKLLAKLKGQVRQESYAKTVHWPDWERRPATEAWSDQAAGVWGSTALLWFMAFTACLAAEWGLRRKWGMV